MTAFSGLLAIPPLSTALLPLPAAGEAFLVGGALRNTLLGLPVTDFDFVTPFDPTALARAFATHCGGRWFVLDASRSQSRVVWTSPEGTLLTFDFAPYRAADLDGDLHGRDFTVNALALALGTGKLYDPLKGVEDLEARLLRECAPKAFTEDPLRILRSVRLAVTLDFTIEPGTWVRATGNADLLAYVPAERRGDEVVRIVNHSRAAAGPELLAGLGLVAQLFGTKAAGDPEWRGRAGERLARLDEFTAWLGSRRPQMYDLLEAPVGRSLSRLGRLRLACLLGPGPLDTADLDARLALGRETLDALELLHPIATETLAIPPLPTRRARARWAEPEPYAEDRLLLSAALTSDSGAREEFLEVLAAWLGLQQEGRIPDLVDGHWIARNLEVAPGPELGELVAELRAAELSGAVKTPDEARKFLILLREKTIDKKNGEAL